MCQTNVLFSRVISFTGSTPVGARIAALAAPSMKKLSLELGGKNAAVVFGDVDLDKVREAIPPPPPIKKAIDIYKQVVPALIRSSFLNQGEICLCTSR